MYANARLQAESFVKAPHPRQPTKKFVSVQINTDPWSPVCQRCMERDKSSASLWGSNLININEYVKAINYINSIHNIINGALVKKAQHKDEAVNFLSKFSMPDLPNFLALLSNLNTSQNCGENVDREASKATSTAVTKTTSTSTLATMEPLCDEHVYEMEKHDSDLQLYESGFGDHDQPNRKELVLQSALAETRLSHHRFVRNFTRESIIDSDSSESNEVTEYLRPRKDENKGCNPKRTEKNFKVINLAGSMHKLVYPNEKSVNQRQRSAKTDDSVYEKTRCVGDRFRTNPPPTCTRRPSPQRFQDWKLYMPNRVNVKANKQKEQTLSDAELDRYATELLYGSSSPPSVVKLHGDHSRSNSPRTSGSTTAMLKKNLAQNIKEVATKCLEKQTMRNPTQRKRSKSPRSNSKPKNAASKEILGDARKQSWPNSSATVINLNNKGHPRKKSPATACSTMECNKKEVARPKQEKALKAASKPPVVDSVNEVPGESASSSLVLPAQKFVILPRTSPEKTRANTTLKRSPTWVVQQKDYDDFVCQVKKSPSRVSGTSVMAAKEDSQRNARVDSAANRDASGKRGEEYNKQYHVQGNKRNGWCTEKQPHSFELTKEPPSPAIPLKTKIRNQPFRQPRKECIEHGEIIAISDCAAHETNYMHSGSTSNLSQSSYSSDIKSDRAPSPVYRSERLPSNAYVLKLGH